MKTKKTKMIFAVVSGVLLSLTLVVISAKALAQNPPRWVEPGDNLVTAKVLNVEAHPEGRPYAYAGDGTIFNKLYDNYPYYYITLQVGDKQYLVQYDNMGGYYPAAWRAGHEVKIRKNHGISILRYDGVLVPVGVNPIREEDEMVR
jgi:hypothetical protein